jgi:Flp pilus assembly protein TadG
MGVSDRERIFAMNAHQSTPHRESGQSLILVAAAIFGMLAFLGLAVDGGNVYLQRRNAQNAADAAAQAGTIALAQNALKPTAQQTLTEKQLCAIMKDYGTVRNETDPAQFQPVYAYRGVPISCSSDVKVKPYNNGGDGARAITGISPTSMVSQILGRTSFRVAANSTVQYGPPAAVTGCCLHPVAILDDWIEGRVDQNGNPISNPQPRYNPSSPNDPNNPANVPNNQIFTLWDDGKGTPGNRDISGGNRGWVNLSCKDNRDLADETCNASNADVKEWMGNGYKGGVQVGDELYGDPGVRASAIQVAEDRLAAGNATLNIPVYHATHTSSGKTYYHVVGFAAFRMTKVVSTGSVKGIEGYFVNYITAGQMGAPGSPFFGTIVVQPTG